MKTRYTSLVSVKKNIMKKSERVLLSANETLQNAQTALQLSLESLGDINTPDTGMMSEFLSSRMLLDAQRTVISHNQEWLAFAQEEILKAKEQLKLDSIEYEKFNYLELQEIKKIVDERKKAEAKELDEVALMTFTNKNKKDEF